MSRSKYALALCAVSLPLAIVAAAGYAFTGDDAPAPPVTPPPPIMGVVSISAPSPRSVLSGVVVVGGRAAEGVRVEVTHGGGTVSTVTEPGGGFRFEGLADGDISISCSREEGALGRHGAVLMEGEQALQLNFPG
jgi:hypothetical protein